MIPPFFPLRGPFPFSKTSPSPQVFFEFATVSELFPSLFLHFFLYELPSFPSPLLMGLSFSNPLLDIIGETIFFFGQPLAVSFPVPCDFVCDNIQEIGLLPLALFFFRSSLGRTRERFPWNAPSQIPF